MSAWMLRHSSRLNCSVIPAVLFIAFIAIAFAAVHRNGARLAVLAAAVAVAGGLVLAMAAAIALRLARSRRPPAATRLRQPASQPPAAQAGCTRPLPTGQPGDPEEEPAAGQPAEAELAAPTGPDWDGYRLTQPPVIPDGETIGQVDMTAFEGAQP